MRNFEGGPQTTQPDSERSARSLLDLLDALDNGEAFDEEGDSINPQSIGDQLLALYNESHIEWDQGLSSRVLNILIQLGYINRYNNVL